MGFWVWVREENWRIEASGLSERLNQSLVMPIMQWLLLELHGICITLLILSTNRIVVGCSYEEQRKTQTLSFLADI